MTNVEQLRQQVEAMVHTAPVTMLGAIVVVALLWLAWYMVRGQR